MAPHSSHDDESFRDFGSFASTNRETYDGIAAESISDLHQTARMKENNAVKTYWHGKIFFDYVLSDHYVQSAKSCGIFTCFNENMEIARSQFPYGQCLNKISTLAARMPSSVSRSQQCKMLMTKIGSLLTVDDGEQKDRLMFMIQENAPTVDFRRHDSQKHPPSPPESRPATPPNYFPEQPPDVREPVHSQWKVSEQPRQKEEFRMGIYATRLKEYCDKKQWQIESEDFQLGYQNSWWKVEIRVQGQVFHGEAGSKKDARFIACRKACRCFNIRI